MRYKSQLRYHSSSTERARFQCSAVVPYLQTRCQERSPALVLEPVHGEELVLLAQEDQPLQRGQRVLRGDIGTQTAHT